MMVGGYVSGPRGIGKILGVSQRQDSFQGIHFKGAKGNKVKSTVIVSHGIRWTGTTHCINQWGLLNC